MTYPPHKLTEDEGSDVAGFVPSGIGLGIGCAVVGMRFFDSIPLRSTVMGDLGIPLALGIQTKADLAGDSDGEIIKSGGAQCLAGIMQPVFEHVARMFLGCQVISHWFPSPARSGAFKQINALCEPITEETKDIKFGRRRIHFDLLKVLRVVTCRAPADSCGGPMQALPYLRSILRQGQFRIPQRIVEFTHEAGQQNQKLLVCHRNSPFSLSVLDLSVAPRRGPRQGGRGREDYDGRYSFNASRSITSSCADGVRHSFLAISSRQSESSLGSIIVYDFLPRLLGEVSVPFSAGRKCSIHTLSTAARDTISPSTCNHETVTPLCCFRSIRRWCPNHRWFRFFALPMYRSTPEAKAKYTPWHSGSWRRSSSATEGSVSSANCDGSNVIVNSCPVVYCSRPRLSLAHARAWLAAFVCWSHPVANAAANGPDSSSSSSQSLTFSARDTLYSTRMPTPRPSVPRLPCQSRYAVAYATPVLLASVTGSVIPCALATSCTFSFSTSALPSINQILLRILYHILYPLSISPIYTLTEYLFRDIIPLYRRDKERPKPMFHLTITKTEMTLNGVNLDRDERANHIIAPAIGGIQNSEVVQHTTTILDQPFRTAKAAWAAATPELIDRYGLVWDAGRNTYDTDFAGYDVNVTRK